MYESTPLKKERRRNEKKKEEREKIFLKKKKARRNRGWEKKDARLLCQPKPTLRSKQGERAQERSGRGEREMAAGAL